MPSDVLNNEWVSHIIRDSAASSDSGTLIVMAPLGWNARLNPRRVETWDSMIRELLGYLDIPHRGLGKGAPLENLRYTARGREWGTMQSVEELVVLGRAIGAIDFEIEKFGRPHPLIYRI